MRTPGSPGSREIITEIVSESIRSLAYLIGILHDIGRYFHQEDRAVGLEILARKITRMREKLVDRTKFFTFDLFEEMVFAILIEYAKSLYADDAFDMDEENRGNDAANTLIDVYGMPPEEAIEIGNTAVRLYLMDNDMYFWDDDYSVIWTKGFIEGIKLIKSAAGDQLGYGYEYAEASFTDIGIKAPIRLLGSREANRLVNEEEAKRMQEMTEALFSAPGDLEKLLGTVAGLHDVPVAEVSSSIEELLKTIPDDVLQERFGGEVPTIEEFIKYIISLMKEDNHNS